MSRRARTLAARLLVQLGLGLFVGGVWLATGPALGLMAGGVLTAAYGLLFVDVDPPGGSP